MLHLVVINRLNSVQTANITLTAPGVSYIKADVYAMLNNSNGVVTAGTPLNSIAGNNFSFSAQPNAVYHLVLKTANAGTGLGNVTDRTETIYPNPSKGTFTLNTTKEINSVEAFDISGKKMNLNVHGNNFSIAEKGLWLLKVKFTDGTEMNEKVVVEP